MKTIFRSTIACFLMLFLVSCAAPTLTLPSPTPPEGSLSGQPTESVTAYQDFLTASACTLEKQKAALVPDHWDDLQKAGINACYDLTLQINPSESSYTGTLDLDYLNESGTDISDLVFRTYPNTVYNYAGQLIIDAAKIANQSVQIEDFLADHSALRIALPQSLAPWKTMRVTLSFHGMIPQSTATYGIFNHDASNDVLTLANAYPLLAARDEKGWLAEEIQPLGDAVTSETGLYHVRIQIPEDWKVAATGTQIQQQIQDDLQEIELVSGPTRDFMMVASPNFNVQETVNGSTIVREWALPDFEPEQLDGLQAAVDALELFSEKYGAYPFAELDVVSAPLNNASGVEYPGLILIGYSIYSPKADPNIRSIVIAHEVAHQWWYSLIGNDVQVDPWQDESLASYSSFEYLESKNPAYLSGTIAYFETAVQEFEQSPTAGQFIIADPLSAYQDQVIPYVDLVYRKGALFFWELRKKIGDTDFEAALKEYYRQNSYQLVGPEVLLSTFEKSCGCDLTGFYRDWGVEP